MSAQKNKKFDLDSREQNQSVVQRFITKEVVLPEEHQEEEAQEESPSSAGIFKDILTPAEPEEPVNTQAGDTQAIAAQLEKLHSRLEQFESKVAGLDKLEKLDRLDNLSSLDKLNKLDGLSDIEQRLNANLGQKNAPEYILFNAMEEAVKEEVRATMNNVNICRCGKCYHDVCALVLNNMIPQYATTQEGVLMKKAKTLLSIDTLTKLSGEIFNAIDKVKNSPEH